MVLSTLPFRSGVFMEGLRWDSFAAWRGGRPVDNVIGYFGWDWATIETIGTKYYFNNTGPQNPTGHYNNYAVIALAMLPSTSFTLDAGANGDYDSHWIAAGASLVANGHADAVIRLGWEFNGNWYPWSAAGHEASFVAYWVRIVNAMRQASGQSFKFDLNYTVGNDHLSNMAAVVPPDTHWDQLGIDFYDAKWADTTITNAARWNYNLTRGGGVNYLIALAKTHGKPVTFDEWGLTNHAAGIGTGGDDDTYFIQAFWDLCNNPANNIIRETYFNDKAPDGDHYIGPNDSTSQFQTQFPNAAALYQKLWSQQAAVTTPVPVNWTGSARTADIRVAMADTPIYIPPPPVIVIPPPTTPIYTLPPPRILVNDGLSPDGLRFAAAIVAPTTKIVSRTDLYYSDGNTLWQYGVGVTDGTVSVDYTRPERRSIDITLYNEDNKLRHYAATDSNSFWYDKIIKCYRGVELRDGTIIETQIGEFMIDTIESQSFPNTIAVTGRDYTKKLTTGSEFNVPTAFSAGDNLRDVITGIALAGGIDPNKITVHDPFNTTLPSDVYFDRGTARWDAISQLTDAFGLEAFFDAFGVFKVRDYQDPVLSPVQYVFKTGAGDGNLISYKKKTSDTRIYNTVVVTGESSDPTVPVVYAVSQNTASDSPTNIFNLGIRTYNYSSPFIYTTAQAQNTADTLLQQHALEEYELTLESLVVPYLEGGNIVQFIDPDPAPNDPIEFLLTSFSIPLGLGSMSPVAKRVMAVT
jgi:hypothetical protein